jgi:murein DD-endopeptidase MepM/ murein hydrolase activator NlpD
MSNPPLWGRGTKKRASGLSKGDGAEQRHDAIEAEGTKENRRKHLPVPRSRSQARTHQAIADAQQGLESLLNPQIARGPGGTRMASAPLIDGHPHVISPSGITRSPSRGRVAGPSVDSRQITGPELTPFGRSDAASPGDDYLLPGADEPGDTSALESGAIVVSGGPDSHVARVPQVRKGSHVTQITGQLQVVRDRARLLVDSPYASSALGLDPGAAHATRRAASQWVTRYATHLVILLVVGTLVALGGLRTFTVQGAYPQGILAMDTYLGTDHISDDHEEQGSASGKPDVDSQEYEFTLPRTELANTAGAEQPSADAAGPAEDAPLAAAPAEVVHYTVAEGDTVESIADKFNVIPETVMGSNGIFDSEEALAPGRVLAVPPIDGMYYVTAEGDSLESIAGKFQVAPDDIVAYQGNKLTAGEAIKPGQELVVPGGMMPERQTAIVYTVKRGDSLRDVAARFGVDVPTMLNSNDIPDPDHLQPGSQLRVLPVPGIEYKVKKGDNVNEIADRFGVTPQMILDYQPNHLTVDSALQIDQVIMVPGGSPEQTIMAARVAPREQQPSARGVARPEPPKTEPKVVPKPAPKAQPKAQPKAEANAPTRATGRFVWPVSGRITQYFSRRHNGLDIATRAGTPIHAADSGRVIWAGWRTDGLGYCVMIDHGNGLTTVYGHMIRQPPVYVGKYVTRGQVIGYIGSTGRSTGPHVHFMVKVGAGRNYRNPLGYLGK